jgi:hypothetical protein
VEELEGAVSIQKNCEKRIVIFIHWAHSQLIANLSMQDMIKSKEATPHHQQPVDPISTAAPDLINMSLSMRCVSLTVPLHVRVFLIPEYNSDACYLERFLIYLKDIQQT